MNCDVTIFYNWKSLWFFDNLIVLKYGTKVTTSKMFKKELQWSLKKLSKTCLIWMKMSQKRSYAPDCYDRLVNTTRERWDEYYKRSKQNLSTMSSSSPTIIIFFVSISYQGVARMLHYSISVWQIVLRQFLVPLWFSIVSWTIKW